VANWLKYIENNAAKSGVNGPHAAVPALPRLALSSVPSTLCPHVEQRDAVWAQYRVGAALLLFY
jgi:hypothetical protein